MQFISHCYKPETPGFPLCHPPCDRARCGRISRPLFEYTLSTGADEAGMQNNDSKCDLRSGY